MRGRTALALVAMTAAAPALAVAPFTVVALPDTQYYTQTTANNNTYFKGQTNWIVANKVTKNIAFVLGLGDIQNDGNPYYASATDPYSADTTRPTGYVSDYHEWINADASLRILDAGGVPYSVVAGNHDYIHYDIKEEPYNYVSYFGPARFAGKSWFGGGSPATPTTDLAGMNSWYLFDAGGRKWLNIGLQFQPDSYDLAWAQSVVNQHPGVPTIITTHAMLTTATSTTTAAYSPGGAAIWNTFARNNPQVIMTLNGHVNGTNLNLATNLAGQTVPQMLVDYQSTVFDTAPFKGGGYLRLMEFDQDHSVVNVKSYSPVSNTYLTDGANQFPLTVDFNGRFGPVSGIGTYARSATFRQGSNGYAATADTYLDGANPSSTSGATDAGIWVDGDWDGNTSGNQPRHGLLRFDNLIGNAAGQIPAGAVIKSATLKLTTATATNSQTNSSMSLYRMLSPWSTASTWSSMGSGVSANGTEAILSPNGKVASSVQGQTVSFDVTESLYAWLSGAPDYGWAILPGGSDGWRFESSESPSQALRPELDVQYVVAALNGDANLDGKVDADDLALTDRGYLRRLSGWANGDFNADGSVNSADYLLLDTTMARQGGLSAELLAQREAQFGSQYVVELSAAVPEPVAGGLLLACAARLAGRRPGRKSDRPIRADF